MAKNAQELGPSPAGAKPASGGIMSRVGIKIRSTLIDTLLGNIWQIAVITPTLGYLGSWYAGWAPSPTEIASRVRDAGEGQTAPPRSSGIAEVKALGDGAAGNLARELQVRITGKLIAMPEEFGGMRVQYALGPVTSGRGASSATSVQWAMAAQGTGWHECPSVPIAFTSPRALADEIANQINNSLVASKTGKELQCG